MLDSNDTHNEERLNLFGCELRTSAGWQNSPYMANGWIGRIGYSSYITYSTGQTGMLYTFAGSVSDTMNWFETTYYAGIGINLFDAIGAEFQVENVGIGGQIKIGPLFLGLNINIIGGTSLTAGIEKKKENGITLTKGVTIGINTSLGAVVAVAFCGYYCLTTGDASALSQLLQDFLQRIPVLT